MIYILHFDKPLGDPCNSKAMARHYTGSCRDGRLEDRLLQHRSGYGSHITRAAALRGIRMVIGATFPGGYVEERELKNAHNAPRVCNICKQAKMLAKMGL